MNWHNACLLSFDQWITGLVGSTHFQLDEQRVGLMVIVNITNGSLAPAVFPNRSDRFRPRCSQMSKPSLCPLPPHSRRAIRSPCAPREGREIDEIWHSDDKCLVQPAMQALLKSSVAECMDGKPSSQTHRPSH